MTGILYAMFNLIFKPWAKRETKTYAWQIAGLRN